MQQGSKDGWVCVTGATGFVAGHVIEDLLRNGYSVRATVRDPKDREKNKHLLELGKKYADAKLELVAADLSKEGSFDEAVRGCWGVLHTASPVTFVTADPQRELLEPAVKGTLNVLRSCRDAKVRKVVITSSVATVDTQKPKNGKAITEEDHNTYCTLTYGSYSYSKVEAEKAALKFVSELKDDEKFQLATIHPSLVLGPQQATFVTSSNQVIQLLLAGEYPMAPPLHFGTCDVRDVAAAHRAALESSTASGRYIICNGRGWLLDMARIMKKKFPDYPIPGRGMPVFLLRLAANFDKRIDAHTLEEGTKAGFPLDGSKIERELGFKYKYSLEQSVEDTAKSMIALGIVKKKSGSNFPYVLAIIFLVLAVLVYFVLRG